MNPLRKFLQKFGIDLHRYRPGPDKFFYLKSFNFKTVLDIGANIGQFALEIREIFPEAQIYSFEPLKDCFDELSAKFANDKKFKAFNFALGDEKKETEMHKSSYTPSSSILQMSDIHKTLFSHTKNHTSEMIKIKKLDEIQFPPPLQKEILIKIDVQGFEDKVINGGKETFGKAGAIIIENSFVELYRGQPLFDDIYEKLKALGFSYSGSLQEKLNKNTGKIISEDSLFIKLQK